jgi:hypothetical protein
MWSPRHVSPLHQPEGVTWTVDQKGPYTSMCHVTAATGAYVGTKANMPKPHYEVYDIAGKYGHIIIFTPPYSPLSNPIEKIWAVIKNRIATSEERASNLSELAALLEGAVEKITRKTWLGCYKKTREWEDKMSSRDHDFVAGGSTEDLVEAGADEELEEEGGEVSDGGEDEDFE